ncbi:helix-turn-helix transcriptional regulator [Paenibacillus hodogayensis]|uniref:Helix-turn-helix transcriptional regulator n=1 Tax=Paenibacillus hodogayensis TaxID=279208 RepID=A0ABV5VSI5_9BACL
MEHEYDYWNQFHPHVWLITQRGLPFWEEMNYEFGEQIKIHKLSFFYGGAGRVVYNDFETDLFPGMFVYSSPGNWVQFVSSKHDPLQFYSVMFNFALVKWEGWNIPSLHRDERELPLPTISNLKPKNLATTIVQQMHAYWSNKKVGYEWKVNLGFKNLIAELISKQIQAKGEDAALDIVNTVISYINEHYHETIDRSSLSEYVSLSHSHLSLLFKKYTGWSPVQYIIKIRMDKAKELLRDTRKSISTIACEVGYTDPFYFSRVFTKHTGLAPRDYRNA